MLAASVRSAPGYEKLAGSYFLGGATSVQVPTDGVPSGRVPSARQATQPGAEVPDPRGAIPVSSQKPGNREGNARIPYARMMFTFMNDIVRPRYMRQGDVVFVHKTSSAMGHGPNRVTKCGGLPQLNQIMASASAGVTALDFSDLGLADRLLTVRTKHFNDLLLGVQRDLASEQLFFDKIMYDHPAIKDKILALESEEAALKDTIAALSKPAALTDGQVPECDWMALSGITQWTLDGVLISVDDEVTIADTNQPQLSRDDGLLMNVAVQGPTAMRNTAWQVENFRESHESDVQHVDESIDALDKVFVGLFQVPIRNAAGDLERVAFQYQLFSGRQLFVMHLITLAKAPLMVAAPFAHGPTEYNFSQLVGAWRVGSVMDRRLTTDSERQMLVNVCVEWHTSSQLEAEFQVQGRLGQALLPNVPP